jgi:hypothetical protein
MRRLIEPLRIKRKLITSLSLLSFIVNCRAPSSPSAEQMLKDLACGSCHSGISMASDILEKAPDFSQAGLRYSPAFLFSYFLNFAH